MKLESAECLITPERHKRTVRTGGHICLSSRSKAANTVAAEEVKAGVEVVVDERNASIHADSAASSGIVIRQRT